jgi:hypothetical protein
MASRLRFGRGERPRSWNDDVEFVALVSGESTPSRWILEVKGVRTLGPYEKLVQAWTAWQQMDGRDRGLLQIARRR